MEIREGSYVQAHLEGTRIVRVRRIRGRKLSVVLFPWNFTGENKGKRMRMGIEKICGIVKGKKVKEWHT